MHLLVGLLERVYQGDGEERAGISNGAVSILLLICKTFRGKLDKKHMLY